MPTDLLKFRTIFAKYGDFRFMDIPTLMLIADFMSTTPATGLNTINNILRFFKLRIPIEARGIRFFTQKIITRSMNLYFSKLRQEDELISFESVQNFSDEELNRICF